MNIITGYKINNTSLDPIYANVFMESVNILFRRVPSNDILTYVVKVMTLTENHNVSLSLLFTLYLSI